MNDPPSFSPSANAPGELGSITTALADQRSRWEHGDRVPVEAYLNRFPDVADNGEAALDLICNELLLRRELGESPQLAEYVERFPQWALQLKTQFEVEEAMASESPDTEPPAEASTNNEGQTAKPAPVGAVKLAIEGYEVLEELGRGGQSVVYKARHLGLNRLVALKMIHFSAAADEEQNARFRREAEAVANFSHANIVQIHAVGEQRGRPYIVLEYVTEGPLSKKLAGAPQPPRYSAELVKTLARAMDAAHKAGIIHRDLKPSNVLLARDGSPKITDFGLAKDLQHGVSLTHTGGNIMGTPSYMAPEQAAGKSKDVGPAADVYALGAMLYEMLTGRPPFTGATPLDILPQVLANEPVAPRRLQPKAPRDLETICLKCLEKQPAARYASAAALADDLDRFLAGESIQARPASPWERSLKWARRRTAAATVIAAVFLLSVAGVAAGVYHSITIQRALGVAEKRRIEANRQRDIAKENLQKARQILSQMVIHLVAEMAPNPDAAAIEETRKEIIAKAQTFARTLLVGSSQDLAARRMAALDHLVLANLSHLLGEDAEAQKAMDEAIRIATRLSNEFPDDRENSLVLAAVHHDRAGWLYGTRKLAEAEIAIDESISLFTQAEQETPNDSTVLHNCGNSYNLKGLILAALEKRPECEAAFRKAIEFESRLTKLDGRNLNYRYALALMYNSLATNLEKGKNWSAAGDAFEESINLTKALAEERPDNSIYQQHLAGCYLNFGRMQITSGNIIEGSAHLSTAIEFASKVLEKHPLKADALFLLAKATMLLGQTEFLFNTNRGQSLFEQGANACKSLMRRFPDNAEYRNVFVQSHDVLYDALCQNDRLNDAETVASYAYVGYSELQMRSPEVYAPLAQQSLHRMIDVALQQRKYPVAVWSALQLPAAHLHDAQGHFTAAELIAGCLEKVENDQALSEEERAVFTPEYTKRALEQLRLALDKGFPLDRESLKIAPSFKALHSHPEFNELTER